MHRANANSANPAKKKSKEDEGRVVELHRVLVTITSSLLRSSCSNLRSYSVAMLACHRERWIGKLEKKLEEDLEALKFPQSILDQERVWFFFLLERESFSVAEVGIGVHASNPAGPGSILGREIS